MATREGHLPDRRDDAWRTALLAARRHAPSGLLLRLPEWAVYVRDFRDRYPVVEHGFFAHLESDGRNGRPELRLLFDRETVAQRHLLAVGFVYLDRPTLAGGMYDSVVNAALALTGVAGADERGTTFDDAVAAMLSVFADEGLDEAAAAASIEQQANDLTRAVQQLLYLCADEPDIADIDAPGDRPGRVEGGTKKRWTAAQHARQWDVGYRIANSLRVNQASTDPSDVRADGRRGPRPHLRAAHWHLYWTGPGRTEPRVRWVMPTPVGHTDDLPVVERQGPGAARKE